MPGAFLSTALPPTGPATLQLPATSHTPWVPVAAFACSTPGATAVASAKVVSAGLARPDEMSTAVHAIVASVPCHDPSASAQRTVGAVASMAIAGAVDTALVRPAQSTA